MSSAICFNLDQSKILSSGNGLNSYPQRQIEPSNVFSYMVFQFQDQSSSRVVVRYSHHTPLQWAE